MQLSNVKIVGFRNFKEAEINFNQKSLIIGANDVGKTNLTWALRMLLDKGLSDYDIEPRDSDFYAFEETHEFQIQLKFEEVTEDCVVAKLKGKISDDDELFIAFHGYRDKDSMAKTYKIFIGCDEDELEEVEDRFYKRVLNMKYISCRRDFHNFINREKHNLLNLAKHNRNEAQIEADDKLYNQISTELKEIDEKIPQLSFIESATDTINTELDKLSIHHQSQKIVFDAGTSDIEKFISSVSISSKGNNRNLLVGGDGKLNQIYLSLWAAKHEVDEDALTEVSIICIEEPEAHLHPHQQRKLSEYLGQVIKSQVILTSHSPQVASEFSPNSIIRLYNDGEGTEAASEGCSEIIDEAFQDFGYRMSIIPAEAFFADVVLLIEGPSEELFYKTLAKQLDIDLDRLNISVLMVDGVGFKTYARILYTLGIDFVIRTDNDVMKIPKKEAYRLAGVQRLVGFYKEFWESDENTETVLEENEETIHGFQMPITEVITTAANDILEKLEEFNLFLSKDDLERDLINSTIKKELVSFFKLEKDNQEENDEEDELVKEDEEIDEDNDDLLYNLMTKNKATFMYKFLREKKASLKSLADHPIAAPLIACKKIIEEMNEAD